jgi:hypothetical protein
MPQRCKMGAETGGLVMQCDVRGVSFAQLNIAARVSLVTALAAALLQYVPLGTHAMPNDAMNFAPGQKWTIRALPTANVIIDRIEPWQKGMVVHVSIVNVPIPQGQPGAGGTTLIGHMPFEESALAASVDRLISTGASPPPSFESGYKQWQEAKGGIFTISVEEAIKIVFQTINRRQG